MWNSIRQPPRHGTFRLSQPSLIPFRKTFRLCVGRPGKPANSDAAYQFILLVQCLYISVNFFFDFQGF